MFPAIKIINKTIIINVENNEITKPLSGLILFPSKYLIFKILTPKIIITIKITKATSASICGGIRIPIKGNKFKINFNILIPISIYIISLISDTLLFLKTLK